MPGGGLTLLAGTETLTGANTYTGLTTIKGGTLALSGTGSITDFEEVELATGGKLDISQTTSGASVVTLGNTAAGQTGTVYLGAQTLTISNGSTTFGGVIADKGGIKNVPGGGLTLLAGTETLTGDNLHRSHDDQGRDACAVGDGFDRGFEGSPALVDGRQIRHFAARRRARRS